MVLREGLRQAGFILPPPVLRPRSRADPIRNSYTTIDKPSYLCYTCTRVQDLADLAALPGVQIVSVSDVVPDLAEAIAGELGAGSSTADYQDILADNAVQAVFVTSPTSTHRGG